MESFSVATRFPARRRAMQACVACRMRKTRCDAAQPRCGYCAAQNIECVYRDSQQPRIDYGTQVLLERIQLLEDRLLTPVAPGSSSSPAHRTTQQQPQEEGGDFEMDDVQIPLWHTANANHVYTWPIVRQLLSEVPGSAELLNVDATDVFFRFHPRPQEVPADSWRLYSSDSKYEAISRNKELIDVYFAEVTVFFPLLSSQDLRQIHEAVVTQDRDGSSESVTAADYALLLLVLCLASFMASSENKIYVDKEDTRPKSQHEQLWKKAKLLLGCISDEMSLVAAQCTMLASIYSGACGKIFESFHWAHAAAVKCEALARLYTRDPGSPVPEEFSRLYWVAFIYEGDFVSEISATLPSGIARFEEQIPYPTFRAAADAMETDTVTSQHEELVAFQITTNASIRRFLNRVNSAVYNAKEQQRRQRDRRAEHAAWLLRISQDLWAHHAAVYRNLPNFLLTSSEEVQNFSPSSLLVGSPTAPIDGMAPRGNNVWNILRLKGRYYAGQYIIHRPFVEYALLNTDHFRVHQYHDEILNGCRMCFEGCIGFIRVFDIEPSNSITCLFATGMVTFTMTMILMVATISPLFRDILPIDVEDSILSGLRSLGRFSKSVHEFAWHIDVLERLDVARKFQLVRPT